MPAVRRFGLFVLASVCLLASAFIGGTTVVGLTASVAGAEAAPPPVPPLEAAPPVTAVPPPPQPGGASAPQDLPTLLLPESLVGFAAVPDGTVLDNGVALGSVNPEQFAVIAERPGAATLVETAYVRMSQVPGEVQVSLAIRYTSIAAAADDAAFAPPGVALTPIDGLADGYSYVEPKAPGTQATAIVRSGRDLFVFSHLGPTSRVAELEELARRQSGHLASLGVAPEVPAGSSKGKAPLIPIVAVFVLVGFAVSGWLVLRRSQSSANSGADPVVTDNLPMPVPMGVPGLWDPSGGGQGRSHDAWRDTTTTSAPTMFGPVAVQPVHPQAQPGYPQPGYPQPGYPQPAYAQPAYAQAQAAHPQGTYPQAQAAYPQAAYPHAPPAYPQAAQPQPAHPQVSSDSGGWPGPQYPSTQYHPAPQPGGAPRTVVAGPPPLPGRPVMPANEPPPGHPEHLPSPVERTPMTAWPHRPGLEPAVASAHPRPAGPPPTNMARTAPQRQQTAQTEQLFDAGAPVPLSTYQSTGNSQGGTPAFELMGPPQSSVRGTTPNRNLVAPAGLGLTPPPKPKAKRTLPAGAVPPPPVHAIPPPPRRPGT